MIQPRRDEARILVSDAPKRSGYGARRRERSHRLGNNEVWTKKIHAPVGSTRSVDDAGASYFEAPRRVKGCPGESVFPLPFFRPLTVLASDASGSGSLRTTPRDPVAMEVAQGGLPGGLCQDAREPAGRGSVPVGEAGRWWCRSASSSAVQGRRHHPVAAHPCPTDLACIPSGQGPFRTQQPVSTFPTRLGQRVTPGGSVAYESRNELAQRI